MCSTLKDTDLLSYQDASAWLSCFESQGWVLGLERITYLLKQLGNPHEALKVVHVAGSNGKGSVCKYISSIFQKAGYRVGLYLSPHIERFSERIVVNNQEISEEDLAALVSEVRPFVEDMTRENNTPTYFEIVTALAFLYFKQRAVDYAVVEVGLGGRYDATNVVTPLVSVITNISLEHTDILGKNLTSIANEKAGIIKQNVSVITGATHEALETIKQVADERDAPLVFVDQSMWTRLRYEGRCQEFLIQGYLKEYTVQTSLLGLHQGENIAVAIAAVEQLQMIGIYLTDTDIIAGIAATSHPGRMEIVSENPLILLDGAHNPAGMNMLAKTIQQDFSSYRLIIILGVLKDKDITMMVSAILPLAEVVIATKSANPRAADPVLIQNIVKGFDANKTVVLQATVPEAITHARRIAQQHDLICVSGSLFTVGDARRFLISGEPFSERSVS